MSEQDRIEAVRKTGLLDSAPEENFDRITRLAANALGAEIALISLVDKDRQFFKSRHGLSLDQTDRDLSFCHHAIKQEDVMVVLNASEDPRFNDNRLVTGDPNIAFYAGAPLIDSDGHALGTICVIDDKAWSSFSERERQILADLASSVMTEIENVESSQTIDDLTIVARELQHRMGNVYSHIASLVSIIDRTESDKEKLAQKIRQKITSLAQTQALLAANDWQSVSMTSLTDSALAPFCSELLRSRISTQTSHDFDVSARGAFTLTLMLSKLGTNAVKHGALTSGTGAISFGWTKQDDRIRFKWRELNKLPDSPHVNSEGFGMKLLREIVPLDLYGEADHRLSLDGLVYTVSAMPDRVYAH